MFKVYVNSKVHPRTGHEGRWGQERYSCTLALTSVLDGVGQCHALGGTQGRPGRLRKISPSLGYDSVLSTRTSCYNYAASNNLILNARGIIK